MASQATLPAVEVAAAVNDGKKHLLLAASGSVATIKIPCIVTALSRTFSPSELSIRIVLTDSATHFLAGQAEEQPHLSTLKTIPCVDGIYLDADEWTKPGWIRGASILHIELRRWADFLVIAPMSANLLAKVTNGICDDLLTCVIRAWDVKAKTERLAPGQGSILVAPAMNTMMWAHPLTAKQLNILSDEWDWFEVLLPQSSKALACGDVGQGAMMEWPQIVEIIEQRLGRTTKVEEAT
jgi:phosphopantothenoylcysteine decarboxylase